MLKKIFGVKKVVKNNKIKRYFLHIPFFKKKWNDDNIKFYFCGLQYLCVKLKNNDVKIYLLGLKILSYTNFKVPFANQTVAKTNNTILTSAIQLKSLELLAERKNCYYEKEQM